MKTVIHMFHPRDHRGKKLTIFTADGDQAQAYYDAIEPHMHATSYVYAIEIGIKEDDDSYRMTHHRTVWPERS